MTAVNTQRQSFVTKIEVLVTNDVMNGTFNNFLKTCAVVSQEFIEVLAPKIQDVLGEKRKLILNYLSQAY